MENRRKTIVSVLGTTGAVLAMIAYLIIGTIQFLAIFHGGTRGLGWHWLIVLLVGCILAYIPLVGSIFGVWAAMHVWGWPFWPSLLLFFGWFVLLALLGLAAITLETIFGKRGD
jgi:hypothetical protein